ncbi:TPA: hypothetical protein HA281_05810 [Candidatus Woesearchaeota archaeon]|nr:MAG: PpiC-type peptidyl-prolyl cis-trans isomerase [archaeon GW2011_AR11]HIH05250.1 hypothetical protein [Candidatus Woesearchaeota archaeon]HIH92287.1 hypothetical protein [Candidatus Woesearchaeota archaeon]HII64727.1 hypothetical protein [Candidatus Woesearchaeota archaeon]HIJ18114.1 hypothetical protein [Candidatus Woesearchaeota archaeon]
MARKKKRPSSRKRSLPRWQIILVAVLGIIIIGALAIVVAAFIHGMFKVPRTETVATVNGEPVSARELDYSYGAAVPQPYRQFVSKWQFLNESIIPQKLLLQEAVRQGYSASDGEVRVAIDAFLRESGMTPGQLDEAMKESGMEQRDMEATVHARLTISRFVNATILPSIKVSRDEVEDAYDGNDLGARNLSLEQAYPLIEQQLLAMKQGDAILAHINSLRAHANITIFIEQAKEGITSFRKAGDSICAYNGSIMLRMYTSSACGECKQVALRLAMLLGRYQQQNASLIGAIWELDTGDNLLTKSRERGVPPSELEIFRKISPENRVPAYSFGCTYTRVGSLPGAEGNLNAEEREFTAVLDTLLYDYG